MAEKKRGLGRGLSALMADVAPREEARDTVESSVSEGSGERLIPVEKIEPNPNQPRRDFEVEPLKELADSIRERGIIQPLILREVHGKSNTYEIVAGERRWRAAQMAQLHEVPAIVRAFTDEEVLEVAIIENVQREDLNPVEEALGYRQLIDRFGHTQEHIATALGKSRSHVANLMRLLQLPVDVQDFLRDGKLSSGHARALITSDSASELAREVIKKGLSVRQTEKLVKSGVTKAEKAPRVLEKDADTRALESDLSAALGLKVTIDHAADGAGQLLINYRNLDDLDAICRVISAASMDKPE